MNWLKVYKDGSNYPEEPARKRAAAIFNYRHHARMRDVTSARRPNKWFSTWKAVVLMNMALIPDTSQVLNRKQNILRFRKGKAFKGRWNAADRKWVLR